MKKVLIIFSSLILFFFLKTSPILASCTTLTFPNTTCLTPGTSFCTNTSGQNFCCTGNGTVLGTAECQLLIGPPAPSQTNTFSCKWTGAFCVLDTSVSNCSSGYGDGGACNNVTGPNVAGCYAIKNQPCVANATTGGGTSTSATCTPIGGVKDTGISTAIGCIPVLGANGTTDFLTFILRWAVGIGGGIAFLLILYAGFMIMTSSGNPERLKAGQELLTSAISGLILLIFSVFILKFIGVDILGLGAFGFGK